MHKNNAVNLRTNQQRLAQRSHKLIVVLSILFLPLFSRGQETSGLDQPGKIKGVMERKNLKKPLKTYRFSSLYVLESRLGRANQLEPKADCYFSLSPGFYVQCLGYFCKQEIKLEKITSIPIRFRLGGFDYVNWLEQKPNAIKPR